MSVKCTFFVIFTVTLKPGLGVIQGYWKICIQSIKDQFQLTSRPSTETSQFERNLACR